MSIVYPYIYSEDSIYMKKVDSIFDRELMHSHEFFEIQYVLVTVADDTGMMKLLIWNGETQQPYREAVTITR